MRTKIIHSGLLAITGLLILPAVQAASCNSEADYFTAVQPFNTALNNVESASFTSALCGQAVTVTSVSGEPLSLVTIPTTIRADGSLVYADDVQIKVGDTEVFKGQDFTREDLDRLLQALGSEVASEATIAQTQQINRQTYNTISMRLMNIISRSFVRREDFASVRQMLASADDSAGMADAANAAGANSGLSVWSEVSYANIEDDNQAVNFNTDIFQLVSGVDKRFGDLIIGSALTYAHGDNQQSFRNYSSNSIGITPYIAYKITDFMFLSGLLGYNYTGLDSRSAAPGSDFHEFTSEGNINFYKVIDAFVVKGRIGVRYTYGNMELDNGRSGSSDSVSAIGDMQLDYFFNENLNVYIGGQYEHLDRNADGINAAYRNGVFYFRSGLDYAVSRQFSVGALIETDLSDQDRNLLKGGINFRLSL